MWMKKRYRRSSHTVYDLKYHFVFCPKYRYGVLEGDIKNRLRVMIEEMCEAWDILIEEGHICEDHVHLCLSIPPKYSPSEVMKKLKGESSQRIFREFPVIRKRYWGQRFWARGFFVSSVGIDEEVIKKYIQDQDKLKSKEEQIRLWE